MKHFFSDLVFLTLAASAAASQPNFVPWPESVNMATGTMPLTAHSRIVAQDPVLLPLAQVLGKEIRQITGLDLASSQDKPGRGDIALVIDPKLKREAYRLQIADRATVQGGNYAAVALGTVTLLQALVIHGHDASIPCLSIDDRPKSDYRGLMVDVARRYHSIASLKDMVNSAGSIKFAISNCI